MHCAPTIPQHPPWSRTIADLTRRGMTSARARPHGLERLVHRSQTQRGCPMFTRPLDLVEVGLVQAPLYIVPEVQRFGPGRYGIHDRAKERQLRPGDSNRRDAEGIQVRNGLLMLGNERLLE